jgi:hypothetical protein
MLGNEIDDTAPPRCLVHSSTVVDAVPSVSKKFWKPSVGWSILPHDVDIALMNDLADRGLKMVLFGYESDPVTPEDVLKAIDIYQHPFNEWLTFQGVTGISRYLAMQGDVRYVIDRHRPLAFGARSLNV